MKAVPYLIFFSHDGNMRNTGEKVGDGIVLLGIFLLLSCSKKGSSAVDDSTTWKCNTEGNVMGHEILSVTGTGNHVIQSHPQTGHTTTGQQLDFVLQLQVKTVF